MEPIIMCSKLNCTRQVHAKGMCRKHYMKAYNARYLKRAKVIERMRKMRQTAAYKARKSAYAKTPKRREYQRKYMANYYRTHPKYRQELIDRMREYRKLPKVREYRRNYQREYMKTYRKEYNQRPYVKAKKRMYNRIYKLALKNRKKLYGVKS